MKATWTLLTLSLLGGTAYAEQQNAPVETSELIRGTGSHRGVAQNYLVLPSGGEITGQMRFLMSEPMFDNEAMKFSDLALFGIGARWSLFSKLELALEGNFLAKQPSFTDEKPWQSVGGTLRSPLGKNAALQIGAAGGHLIAHEGMWTKESLMIQWRHPIHEFLKFDIAGGMDGVSLGAPNAGSAFITEVALATSALFSEPGGHWGAWIGMAYAVPVAFRGQDPTTEMSVDPQPRLDFRVGTVLSLERKWDLFVEFAVVDRGDIKDPATRLPILDGGFDQRQVIFGVTRHIDVPRKRRSYDDDAMYMSQR